MSLVKPAACMNACRATNMENPLDKVARLHLIVVDDNPDDHFFIRIALAGYPNVTIRSFYSGEQFLNYLVKEAAVHVDGDLPDIVLMAGLSVFDQPSFKENETPISIAIKVHTLYPPRVVERVFIASGILNSVTPNF